MPPSDPPQNLADFFAEFDSINQIEEESHFKCSKVPVSYSLELSIPVKQNNSTVRYAFGTDGYDINFSMFLRKDDGSKGPVSYEQNPEEFELRSSERVNSHTAPVTGSLVITEEAPCVVILCWDNHYSWLNSKSLSYSVTVRPPSKTLTAEKNRERLEIALSSVTVDLASAETRLERVKATTSAVEMDIARLQTMLDEKKASMEVAEKEEVYLKERVEFRTAQVVGLKERIVKQDSM